MSKEEKKLILVRVSTIENSLWKIFEEHLEFMNQYFEVHAVSTGGKLLEEVRDREGVEVHPIYMHRGISPLHDIKSIFKMVKLFRKLKPTIVHGHTPKAGLVSMVAGRLTGVPIRLYTIAGIPFETFKGFRKWTLIQVEKIIYTCAHKVYPNSFGHKKLLENLKIINPNKLKVLAQGSTNGINIDRYKATPELWEKAKQIRQELKIDDSFVFLYVSRLVKHKGAEEMLLAFNQVNKQYPRTKLLICGRMQEDTSPLSKEAMEILDKNEDVIFTGYQLDIRPYYLAGDLFTFPSLREGLPNVLMQAGAMGRAVVCSDILGNTDIVKNDVNGIIVKHGDVRETKEAMIDLMLNHKKRKQIEEVAREHIVKKYNRKHVLQAYLQEYSDLLSEKNIDFNLS